MIIQKQQEFETIDDYIEVREYEIVEDVAIPEPESAPSSCSAESFRWWRPAMELNADVGIELEEIMKDQEWVNENFDIKIMEDQELVFQDCIEEDHDLFEDAVDEDEDESVRRGDPRPPHCAREVMLLESEVFDDVNVAEPELAEWYEEPFEVALDSGSGEHVADEEEVAPAYTVTSSPGSRAGQHFVSAARQRIPNKGQFTVVLKSGDGGGAKARVIRSTFQSAKVTRPLWSVGRICDEGFDVKFNRTEALILTKQGKVVCRFERRGGLYIARLQLKNPLFERFTGPGTHN